MFSGETSPWLQFEAWNADHTPNSSMAHDTAGLTIYVVRDNLADSVPLTLSAASGPTDHAAGKFLHVVGNVYKVAISTPLISGYQGKIALAGTFTGGDVVGLTEIVTNYDPSTSPSIHSANDVLTAIQGVTLTVGLVASQRVQLASSQPDYPPATPGDLQPACEAALTTHGAATQAQLQPAGEAALATHGTATQAQLEPAVAAGLAAYDPPTKAEMDAAIGGLNVWTNTQITDLLASVADIATETKRIPRAAAELTPGGQHRLTIGGQWVVQTISLESP